MALALAATMGAAAVARDLRSNINADPEMIDPIAHSALIAGDMFRQMYEGLTDINAEGRIVPALAERWEALPDGLGWRFHLRRGVVFHSGRPFTARDVKYTFEQLNTPGRRAGLATQYVERIVGAREMRAGTARELAGITIVDDHTIEIRFTAPDVLFPIYPFYIIDSGIEAERGAEWYNTHSAGTGPFSFVHWRRGQEVRMARHDRYWGGRPQIDGLQFLIVPSDDTAASMYEAGELDVFRVTAPEMGRRVIRDARLANQIIRTPAAQVNYLGMNQNLYPPFRDRRVREAFCIAIDREAMSRGLFGGLAEPLNGQITPGVAGYNPNVPRIAFNPQRAQQLLAEAGFPGGRGMPPLRVANLPEFRNEIAYFADQWRQVLGVTVELDVQERATFIRAMNAGEVPFFSWGWTAGYPDALYFLSQMWHSRSPFNRPRWSNAEFDRVIDQAQITPDNEARYRLYAQAEQILLQDWGTCGLYIRTQVAVVRPNVRNVVLTPFRFLPFGNVVIN